MRILFFISILLLSVFAHAEVPQFIELKSSKTAYEVGEKGVLLVSVKTKPNNANSEVFLESTFQEAPLKIMMVSDTEGGSVTSSFTEAGSFTWEVRAYLQDRQLIKDLKLGILKSEQEILRLKELYRNESDTYKKTLLLSSIAEQETLIDQYSQQIKNNRLLVETKQLFVNVYALKKNHKMNLSEPLTVTTGKIDDTFNEGDSGEVTVSIHPDQISTQGPLKNEIQANWNGQPITAIQTGENSFKIVLTPSILIAGYHYLDVSLYVRNKKDSDSLLDAIVKGSSRKVSLELLRDSAVTPELAAYYQSEIDDLVLILSAFATVHEEMKVYVANVGKSINVLQGQVQYNLVSAGVNHTCAIRNDSLFCWGTNGFGNLGVGDTTRRIVPTPVISMQSGVTFVSSGNLHACAIKDGALYCWGDNAYGQLGDGTFDQRLTPTAVTNMSFGVTDVAVGETHTCAVKNGEAYCWGSNLNGELGSGDNTDYAYPNPVNTYDSITDVAAGTSFSCGITAMGSLLCWGANGVGQLGDYTNTSSSYPVQAYDIYGGVSRLSLSDSSACAVVYGALKCWGENTYGQLGSGDTWDYWFPSLVPGWDSDVTDVDVGKNSTCAIRYGQAYCWGRGASGALGTGSIQDELWPMEVYGLTSGVTSISHGGGFGCAVHSGELKCWGINNGGSLGNGTEWDGSLIPIVVNQPVNFKSRKKMRE